MVSFGAARLSDSVLQNVSIVLSRFLTMDSRGEAGDKRGERVRSTVSEYARWQKLQISPDQ